LIRFALFGAGRIGRVHADSIDVHPRAQLAWVYDPIESAAREVAKRYGVAGPQCRCCHRRPECRGGCHRLGHSHPRRPDPTSVRLSNATQTEAAREYLNFFLDRYRPAYRAELDHLTTSMEHGSQPSPGFSDGRQALVLADAAVESLRTGQVVRLD
jgi:radical SAM protein with 4Fe4S-binding SPASM domain